MRIESVAEQKSIERRFGDNREVEDFTYSYVQILIENKVDGER